MSDAASYNPFPGVTVSDDVEAADWIRAALRPWSTRGVRVASFVPAAFPAHGRILHRAWRGTQPVRWSDVAASTGNPLASDSDFADLVDWRRQPGHQGPPEPWDEPDHGSLLPDECAAAADVLRAHTATPDDCWFCVWAGYGWTELDLLRARGGFRHVGLDATGQFATAPGPTPGYHPVPIAPMVSLEHRDCILFHGAVTAATAFQSEPWYQSPTLWWPADRAWCVASELDIFSAYVACSPAALDALIDHPALEVLRCSAEQVIDAGAHAIRLDDR